MKKMLFGLLLATSFVLAACDTGTVDSSSSDSSSDTQTTDTTTTSDSTGTIDVRQEWTSDEAAVFDSYFFEGASQYVPCYVPEGGALTDAYFDYYGCLNVEATVDSAVGEQLVTEYVNIIKEFGYYAEWYSDEWGYTYYYDLSETAYLNIDTYYDSDYFCIDVYYVNTVPTIEVRQEWTSEEIAMFDSYFFEGASQYVPCYVPEGGTLTDVYFEDYGCLTVEAQTTDVGLAYEFEEIIINFGYTMDSEKSMYVYNIPNSTDQFSLAFYIVSGYFQSIFI